MTEFIRARSDEQKQLRMNEIMSATDKLFANHTYHDITLTTIAQALGWSRGNLYKYVCTKEEIFLELYLVKQQNYFEEIKINFKSKSPFPREQFAALWAETLDHHHDFLHYYGILTTIIETNVTVERLAEFKKKVMSSIDEIIDIIEIQCQLSHNISAELFWTLLYHACGLNNSCSINPLIKEAMKLAGLAELKIDFVSDFTKFILICLKGYC